MIRPASILKRLCTAAFLSLAVLLPLRAQDNIWTGATSTSWANTGNWSLGAVPTTSHNVRIPRAATLPALTAAGGVARTITFLDSLTGSATATLTVGARILTVGTAGAPGDITINNVGVLSATTGTIALTNGGSLTINSGGTMTMSGAGTININGDWTNNGGTATLTNGTVNFNNTTIAQTIDGTAATQTFFNIAVAKTAQTLNVGGSTTTLSVNTITLTSGTFAAPATMNVALNWTNNGGTFTPGSGTVTFSSGVAQAINGTATSQSFNNLTVNKSANTLSVGGSTTSLTVEDLTLTLGNFTAPATLSINGNLSHTAGTFTSSGTVNIAGNWTRNGGTFTSTGSTVIFNNTLADQAINGTLATQTFNSITVDKSGTTLSIGGSATTLTLAGTLTLTSGTFSAGTAATINVAVNWTNNGGSFTAGTGTVRFNGGGAQNINGTATSQTFNNVTVNKAANTLTVGGSTTSLTTNALTLTAGGFTPSDTLTVNGTLTHTAGTFTTTGIVDANGNWTRNGGTFTGTGSQVVFSGTAAQAIGGTATTSFNDLTISNTSAVVSGNTSFNVAGTMTVNANAIFAPAAAVVINSAAAAGTMTGSGTIRASRTAVTADYANQYKFLTQTLDSMTVQYSGGGNQTINNTVGNYGNLITSGTGTKSLQGAIVVNGDITLSAATLDVTATNFGITLGGDWTNNATFTQRTGLVTFNGTGAESIGGTTSTTFSSLTINKASGTATLTNSVSIAANLSVSSGTYNLSTFTSNRSTSGGTLTVSSGAFLNIGGTGTLPSNFAAHSIGATSTIEYYGGNQTVATLNSSQNYGNLIISGTGTKTLAGTVGVAGDMTISSSIFSLGASTANRTAAGGTLTVSDGATLSIGGTGTIPSNYNTHSIGTTSTIEYAGTTNTVAALNTSQVYGNLLISATGATTANTFAVATSLNVGTGGSLIASAGTVTMNNGSTIANSGTLTFSSLTIPSSANVTSSSSFNVDAALTVGNGATFSPSAGTITMNNGSSISNAGTLSFDGMTIANGATVTTSSSFSIVGALTMGNSSSSFSPSAGTITMNNGSSIVNTVGGTLAFNALTIANSATVTTASNFSVNGALTLGTSSTFNPSGGIVTLNNGSSITNAGTLTFSSLTIPASATVTVNNSFSANATLTLDSDLAMGSSILTLGSAATLAGTSEITGPVRRTTIAAGTTYVYNSANTSLNFASGTFTSPSVTITLTKGATPSGKSDAIQRSYDVTSSGVSAFTTTVRLHYLDAELNSNTETDLVLWKNSGSWTAQGRAGAVDATNNWVELSGVNSFSTWTLANNTLDHFAVSFAAAQTNGVTFTGTNTITAQDAGNSTVTHFDASTDNVTVTSSQSGGVVVGLGSASNNVLNQAANFVNGVASVTGSATFIGAPGTVTFTPTSATAKTGTSGSVTISNRSTNWAGTVASDWNNPANWSNGVPDSTFDVFIPNNLTATLPTGAAHVYSLTLGNNSQLLWPASNGTLYVHGALTVINNSTLDMGSSPTNRLVILGNAQINNNGTFNAGSGTIDFYGSAWTGAVNAAFDPGTSTVNFSGTGTQTITGDFSFYNLTTSSDVTLNNSNVTVTNSLTVSSGTLDAGTGSLTVTGTTSGNYTSTKPYMSNATPTTSRIIELLYSEDVTFSTATNTANYSFAQEFIPATTIAIDSIRQDATNKALVRVYLQQNMLADTTYLITVNNVADSLTGGDLIQANSAKRVTGPAVNIFYSRASGNWSSASSWSNTGHAGTAATRSPGSTGDSVYVANSNTITLDVNVSSVDKVTINSTGTLNTGSFVISGSGSFVLNAGATLDIGSANGITSSGASGNIQVAGTRTYSTGASYLYNGTAAQVTGNGLPSTVADLTFNNAAGVTLSASTSITGDLTISTGTFDLGTNTANRASAGGTLLVSSGATLALGGSSGGLTGSNFPSNFTTITLNGNVDYTGSGAQTIPSLSYSNILFSNGGTKTVDGTMTFGGDFTVNSGAIVLVPVTATIQINGNLVVIGSFTNNGTITIGN